MITIRRRFLFGSTWFEVLQGPEQLRGVFLDGLMVQALVSKGVEVQDADVEFWEIVRSYGNV